MARSKKTFSKNIIPDPVYKSRLATRFINRMMRDGKKTVAQSQFYRTMEEIKTKTGKNPLEVFNQAIENVKPGLEVRPRRIGGAAYQVPAPVRGDRKESLAVRWLILAARQRSSKDYHHFYEKLAAEIMQAAEKQGGAIKKREDIQRMAEANKAFAHFRW